MNLRDPRQALPLAYGAVHAVIDATTVSVVFGAAQLHDVSPAQAFWLVVGYDLLAFGSQAAIGLVTDRLRAPRAVALIGVLVTLLSVVALPLHAVLAVILAGTGNALFHVGAGSISLSVEPGRAAAAGIFVAPGALGLAIGIRVGHGGPFATWPFFLALALSLALLARLPAPPREAPAAETAAPIDGRLLVAALLLFSVAVRAFVGLAGCAACPKSQWLALGMPIAAFGGKALGGLLSDRFGWTRTSVAALLVSAPILAYATTYPGAMLAGMFLFQMTMPVTLAGLALAYPRREAYVFGLACVALVIGALASYSHEIVRGYTRGGFFALIVMSALTLFAGLRLLGERVPRGSVAPPRQLADASARPGATIP